MGKHNRKDKTAHIPPMIKITGLLCASMKETPIMCASREGHRDVVELLANRGSDRAKTGKR